MDQEDQDIVDTYRAGFQNAVEACAEYLEDLAKRETSYFNFSNIYIGIAKELREKIKFE